MRYDPPKLELIIVFDDRTTKFDAGVLSNIPLTLFGFVQLLRRRIGEIAPAFKLYSSSNWPSFLTISLDKFAAAIFFRKNVGYVDPKLLDLHYELF